MNKRVSLKLKRMVTDNPPFPAGDSRNQLVYRRLTRAYLKTTRPERKTASSLNAALTRAGQQLS